MGGCWVGRTEHAALALNDEQINPLAGGVVEQNPFCAFRAEQRSLGPKAEQFCPAASTEHTVPGGGPGGMAEVIPRFWVGAACCGGVATVRLFAFCKKAGTAAVTAASEGWGAAGATDITVQAAMETTMTKKM